MPRGGGRRSERLNSFPLYAPPPRLPARGHPSCAHPPSPSPPTFSSSRQAHSCEKDTAWSAFSFFSCSPRCRIVAYHVYVCRRRSSCRRPDLATLSGFSLPDLSTTTCTSRLTPHTPIQLTDIDLLRLLAVITRLNLFSQYRLSAYHRLSTSRAPNGSRSLFYRLSESAEQSRFRLFDHHPPYAPHHHHLLPLILAYLGQR